MVKNGYQKICKISICLADSCIFIQNGTLLPTGISFPYNIPLYDTNDILVIRKKVLEYANQKEEYIKIK